MKDWRKTLVSPSTPIFEAIQIIDEGALQIALVIEDDLRLVGIVTDGDVRRGLLKGVAPDQPVRLIMKTNFTTVGTNASHDEILALMKSRDLRHIPVLDDSGRVKDLKILFDLLKASDQDNWVIIMAGGLGTRLQPLTNDMPKPLLKVGKKPLLETIIENFVELGFRKFYISVNYMAHMVEKSIGNGSRWNAEIHYIKEEQVMGTAGALGLLPTRPSKPLIVMNGDVLTKVNFRHLLDFHREHRATATMCVREYHFQVPYGVVTMNEQRLMNIDEKPVHPFFVNAGIYVLEPEVISLVPSGRSCDMTTVFERMIQQGHEVVAFPIREYWLDIGKIEDFHRANGEYDEYFKASRETCPAK